MLLSICKHHFLSTEVGPRAQWHMYLVFYSAYFLMWRILELSSSPPSLPVTILSPVSNPVFVPVLRSSSRLYLRSRSRSRPIPAPVPIPVLQSSSRLHHVPIPTLSPYPDPNLVPNLDPVPVPVRSFLPLEPDYPLDTMRVYIT